MRNKVLILAYAFAPGRGSEPGVGWNVAKELASHHDIWVFTRESNRTSVENELKERPIPGVKIIFYDIPGWARWWRRGESGVQIHYYLWQLGAIRAVRKIHKSIGFDIAHHLTYVRYWSPSAAAFLGIPFVWGPVGGGERMPESFLKDMSTRSKVYEWARSAAQWLGEHDPWVRRTSRRASMAIATTPETFAKIRKLSPCPVIQMPEVALVPNEFQKPSKDRTSNLVNESVTLVSAGRLLGWKGYHLAIRAFARADLPNARYVILGDGPEKENLKALVKELGVQDRVEIVGAVPRPEVLERLGHADIFLHPSLHDSGGWATLEAMASGLPVICLDLGGPAVQVTLEVGRKIAAITPDQTVEDLSKAMRELATDADLRGRLGRAAQNHVAANFTWKAKAEQFAKIYEQILSEEERLKSSGQEENHSA